MIDPDDRPGPERRRGSLGTSRPPGDSPGFEAGVTAEVRDGVEPLDERVLRDVPSGSVVARVAEGYRKDTVAVGVEDWGKFRTLRAGKPSLDEFATGFFRYPYLKQLRRLEGGISSRKFLRRKGGAAIAC